MQCSYAELFLAPEDDSPLAERFETLSEDEVVGLLSARYRRFMLLGLDWKRALLAAVDLDAAA
jgi:hypothetical protein